MTGWRIGFAIGGAPLIAALGQVKANTDSGVFTAIQFAGMTALDEYHNLAPPIRALYKERRDAFVGALQRHRLGGPHAPGDFLRVDPLPRGIHFGRAVHAVARRGRRRDDAGHRLRPDRRRLHPRRLDGRDPAAARGRRADRQAEAVSSSRVRPCLPRLIGLGSNLGDREANLNGAIAALASTPGCRRPAGQLVSRDRAGRRPAGPGDVPERRRRCSRRRSTRSRYSMSFRRSRRDSDENGRSTGASGRWISTCCSSTTGSSTRPSCASLIRECGRDDLFSSRWSKSPRRPSIPVTSGRSRDPGRADRELGLIEIDRSRTLVAGEAAPLSFVHRQRAGDPAGMTALAVPGLAMAKKDAAKAKAAGKADDSGIKIVARNRRARHDYELMERVEAGIVLTGTEVKSLRNGRANLEDAYAEVDGGEVWLKGCDIPEYVQGNRMNHLPKRTRKLLLHRREIAKLEAKTGEKGMTLVPLSIYFKKGMAKVEMSRRRGPQDVRQARGDQEAGRQARHRPRHAAALS